MLSLIRNDFDLQLPRSKYRKQKDHVLCIQPTGRYILCGDQSQQVNEAPSLRKEFQMNNC